MQAAQRLKKQGTLKLNETFIWKCAQKRSVASENESPVWTNGKEKKNTKQTTIYCQEFIGKHLEL